MVGVRERISDFSFTSEAVTMNSVKIASPLALAGLQFITAPQVLVTLN